MSDTGHTTLTVRDRGDRRVARTRSAIVNALTEVAREKPLSEVTITELADRAAVGRSTFYDHFESIESLLCWLVDELIDEMRADEGRLQVGDLLLFVGSLPEVSRAFLEIEVCAERCRAALADALPHPDARTRRFAAAGTMDLLHQWLLAGHPEPLDDLSRTATALIDAALGSPPSSGPHRAAEHA